MSVIFVERSIYFRKQCFIIYPNLTHPVVLT